MGLPDGSRAQDGEVPEDNVAISIAAGQSLVVPDEGEGMHLCLMAPEDGARMRRVCHGGNFLLFFVGSQCKQRVRRS